MDLNEVNRGVGKNRPRKRLGRGKGSGLGKTAGKGHKGHQSRSGFSMKPTWQGGQMPMIRRIPKRGFTNRYASVVFGVNVSQLSEVFEDGTEVTLEMLAAKNIAKGTFDEVKILGDGEITKKLTVVAHRFSKSAEEKINAAGGKVVKLPPKRTPDQRVADLAQAKG
jgi:large subunit ribosomal protein L15